MRNLYIVTIDGGYVARALCLYRSMEPWLGDSRFCFFCLDDEAAALLQQLDLRHAAIVRPADYAAPDLMAAKANRRHNEYCWTCKSAALRHAFATWPDLDWAVYVDADMMAYGNPDTALELPDSAHVLLTPHRPSNEVFRQEIALAGQYNAGYIAFRNSDAGRGALDWWLQRCFEFCPAVPTNGVYADQGYLTQMPGQLPGVVASEHKGLNAAPWNIDGSSVTLRDGRVHCDDWPLLIYHFQGMQLYGLQLCDLYAGEHRLPSAAVRHIYRPHVKALAAATREVRARRPDFSGGLKPFFGAPRTLYHQLRRAVVGTNNLSLVLG